MAEPKQSLRTIFNEALEIEDARQRADYLAQACGSDAAVRQKIEELIAADAAAGGFLATVQGPTQNAGSPLSPASAPPSDGAMPANIRAALTEKPGDRIGRYKLLQRIGEGGCGVVYMAQQE